MINTTNATTPIAAAGIITLATLHRLTLIAAAAVLLPLGDPIAVLLGICPLGMVVTLAGTIRIHTANRQCTRIMRMSPSAAQLRRASVPLRLFYHFLDFMDSTDITSILFARSPIRFFS